MRKGRIYPQVATRWIEGGSGRQFSPPPVFIYPSFNWLILTDSTNPLSFFTIAVGPQYLRYNYRGADVSVFWEGGFADPPAFGTVKFTQSVEPGTGSCIFAVQQHLDWVGDDPFSDDWDYASTEAGHWGASPPTSLKFVSSGIRVGRWIAFNMDTGHPRTYSDLYTDGMPTNDIEPASWV